MADGTQRGLAAIVSADVVGYSRFMGVDETGHNSLSNKGNQIWVIREKKTKVRRNNRKRPNVVQKRNENRKEKRRNKLSVTFFACHLFCLNRSCPKLGA